MAVFPHVFKGMDVYSLLKARLQAMERGDSSFLALTMSSNAYIYIYIFDSAQGESFPFPLQNRMTIKRSKIPAISCFYPDTGSAGHIKTSRAQGSRASNLESR